MNSCCLVLKQNLLDLKAINEAIKDYVDTVKSSKQPLSRDDIAADSSEEKFEVVQSLINLYVENNIIDNPKVN